MADAAAFGAWLGASLFVVSDGRRGLALGIGLATAAIAVLAFDNEGLLAAVALGAGGALAAGRRYLSGAPGWGIMPPGSTPRLVLCVAAGLLALWVAAAFMTGSGASLRFAVVLVAGLASARVYIADDAPVLLSAIALLALAIGLAAGLSESPPGPWPYFAAGLIAGAVEWLPARKPRAA